MFTLAWFQYLCLLKIVYNYLLYYDNLAWYRSSVYHMASSKHTEARTPFQDLTNTDHDGKYITILTLYMSIPINRNKLLTPRTSGWPKRIKETKNRERYARNRDEILTKYHEARLLKREAASIVNGEQNIVNTHDKTSHGRFTLYTALLKTIMWHLSLIAWIIYVRKSHSK